MVIRIALLLVVFACIPASAGGGDMERQWQLHDLGGVRPLGMSDVTAINDRGEIVGSAGSSTPMSVLWTGEHEVVLHGMNAGPLNDAGTIVGTRRSSFHAAAWRRGRMIDLGVLHGGDQSTADAINERGEIAGGSRTRHDDVGWHVVIWTAGRMRDLGAAPGPRRDAVPVITELTETGDVVGSSVTDELTSSGRVVTSYPFVWHGGRMIAVGGRRLGEVVGEDARGDVAGTWWLPNVRVQAFLWRNGRSIRLVGPSGCTDTTSVAVDNGGDVLVDCQPHDGSGRSRAFLWSHGRRTDIGTLFPGAATTATAMNDRGDVVGYADAAYVAAPPGSTRHAFVWRQGHMTDLGTLGGDTEATAVNGLGDIIGTSFTRSGTQHAVVWKRRP